MATRLQREDLVRGTLVTPFWPAEPWFALMRGVARRAIVVLDASRLVCPAVQRMYGVHGPGGWPLVFWLMAGPASTSTQPLCALQWTTRDELLAAL